MKEFLVVMDDSREARAALRYASRRAAQLGASVHILALVTQQNISAFGTVQATIEQEARDRAEILANDAAGHIFAESGIMPTITVRLGKAQNVVRDFLAEHGNVAALVLGAAGASNPGPLVSHFCAHAGEMPCPLYIVPEGYTEE